MADTIPRLYLSVYETNKSVGRIFLVVFLLIFVLPFLAVQMTSWTSWMGAVSSERPSRALGVVDMQKIGNEFKVVTADSATLPVLGNRPSRMKGVVHMRAIQVVLEKPVASNTVPKAMPSRAKGVLNMRMGGIL